VNHGYSSSESSPSSGSRHGNNNSDNENNNSEGATTNDAENIYEELIAKAKAMKEDQGNKTSMNAY